MTRKDSGGPSGPDADSGPSSTLRKGTRGYRRASLVMFLAGFLTFALLYVIQGLLPGISQSFQVSPATAALTLSLTTLPLAVAVLVAAAWSEGAGRRPVLIGSLVAASCLTLLAAASPGFWPLLGLRALTGVVLAGFPAVAMAYVAEEFHPSGLGTAMGLYISGTGLGGMTGRLAGGLMAGAVSWRFALAVTGIVSLAAGLLVARALPASRNFAPSAQRMRTRLGVTFRPLRDPVMLRLAACGFVIMGSLVSYYNFLQYRLADPPFDLPDTVVPWVFLLYLSGTLSANWMGRLTDRRGRRGVMILGLSIMASAALVSLVQWLPLVLLATTLMVFGFFGTHSVASGFVGAWAREQRAQSSAVYLFGYHTGSSLAGFAGGLFFGRFGWAGEVGTVLVLLAVGLAAVSGLPGRTALSGPTTGVDHAS